MSRLCAHDVTVRFDASGTLALDGVSVSMEGTGCLGIVGGSGSGKSTFARVLAGLLAPTKGTVELDGIDMAHLRGADARRARQTLQVVFQDFSDAFDPVMSVGASVAEFGRPVGLRGSAAREKAERLARMVGLDPACFERRPYELSGGQLQRASIVRALMVDPKLLICDEITSALDVSVQAEVAQIVRALKAAIGIVFISHDIALVSDICDRVAVMHEGRIVEQGSVASVIGRPNDPYTRQLISASRALDPA